jgi:hypothetical protein
MASEKQHQTQPTKVHPPGVQPSHKPNPGDQAKADAAKGDIDVNSSDGGKTQSGGVAGKQ